MMFDKGDGCKHGFESAFEDLHCIERIFKKFSTV